MHDYALLRIIMHGCSHRIIRYKFVTCVNLHLIYDDGINELFLESCFETFDRNRLIRESD